MDTPSAPLVVVTGPPGAGKTTVCGLLAAAEKAGLRVDSDVFYRFPAHPVDPSLPAADDQNRAVMRAIGATTAAFLEARYRVFLDGIVGPWFLGTLRDTLPPSWPIDYVVLDTPLDESLRRVRARDGAGLDEVVRRVHASFRTLGELEAHRIAIEGDSPERLAGRLTPLLASGRFRLA